MGRYNFNQKTQDGYEISPEQAKKWLEKNDNNRNINYAKVKKMAKDMKEGHWDTTHQGIAIASDTSKCIKKATLPGLNSAGTTAAIIVAAMNDVPAIYIEKFMDVFYSGFTNNEAEHYAITLRDELLRENRVKRGTQYAKFAFYRTANRLNQYYKTATGQRVAKRVNDGDFPYNVYDANGGIVKPETKKAKKVV